ncbi:MAG: sigma-54-dependent transcriptional regulator [Cellvibrionaceae bacterium]
MQKINTSIQNNSDMSDFVRPDKFKEFISEDQSVNAIFNYIESIHDSCKPILVTGENGTGKKLIANICHDVSHSSGTLITINAAYVDDNSFTDTLFGSPKSAILSASNSTESLMNKSVHSTLFVENIDELSKTSQIKLLQWLQERGRCSSVDDSSCLSCARVIVSTSKNLEEYLREGRFRRDLYYQLAIHKIKLPPLRARKNDIPLLLDHFITAAAKELGKEIPAYPSELPVLLANYEFPGNICEFKAMVYDAVSQHRSHRLSLKIFQNAIDEASRKFVATPGQSIAFHPDLSLPSLVEMSSFLIEEALSRAGNNQSLAAKMLGISQPALSMRLKRRQGVLSRRLLLRNKTV